MSRNLTITTLWTAAWEESNVHRGCPGEHLLLDRPGVHYVITTQLDPAERAAYLAKHGITLEPGQLVGRVPERMSQDGYLVSTAVTDSAERAVFAGLMEPHEQLGTVPAAGRPVILLTLAEVGDLIDEHYRSDGDVLIHKEAMPWYDIAEQNADRTAWQHGRFDPTQVRAWTDRLADERRRGMTSKRLRRVSQELTDDELMSLQAALPIIATEEDVRILRDGEHPIPFKTRTDTWVVRPAEKPTVVIASSYSAAGVFIGAEVIPPEDHGPHLREIELGWAIGVPFNDWWAAHPELHERRAAAA